MSFVSYAQNYEDVLLWRALASVSTGFYIDIGALHPDEDSVTRAFYDRGWTGINVEPVKAAFARLASARPRDVNLCCAVGAARGTAPLHVVRNTGLSTTDTAQAADLTARGLASRLEFTESRTLADICNEHAQANIHFLKIDVEGAERQVLKGANFTKYRPWIVLLEAVAPVTRTPTHTQWEDLMLAADYRFVWFDGLNRFYVAAELEGALRPHFAAPPNVFDDFVRPADAELAQRLAVCQHAHEITRAEAVFAALRAQSSDARMRDALLARTELRTLLAARRNELDTLLEAHKSATAAHDSALTRAESAEAALATIQKRWLWRLIRKLVGVIRKA